MLYYVLHRFSKKYFSLLLWPRTPLNFPAKFVGIRSGLGPINMYTSYSFWKEQFGVLPLQFLLNVIIATRKMGDHTVIGNSHPTNFGISSTALVVIILIISLTNLLTFYNLFYRKFLLERRKREELTWSHCFIFLTRQAFWIKHSWYSNQL